MISLTFYYIIAVLIYWASYFTCKHCMRLKDEET